jgi:hypothetical protein
MSGRRGSSRSQRAPRLPAPKRGNKLARPYGRSGPSSPGLELVMPTFTAAGRRVPDSDPDPRLTQLRDAKSTDKIVGMSTSRRSFIS